MTSIPVDSAPVPETEREGTPAPASDVAAGGVGATDGPVPSVTDPEERSKALRKAYGNATTRLREEHRDEFDRIYTEEARALGVDYQPKPTAEQKAEAELQVLLQQYPHLRDKIASE